MSNAPDASRVEGIPDHNPITDQGTPLTHALRLVKRFGWYVFPCKPGGKEPIGWLVPDGQDDASNDPEVIADWLAQCHDANYGINCKLSGLTVPDLDQHDGQPDGVAAWQRLAGALPDTLTVRTATGNGLHLYFRRANVELRGDVRDDDGRPTGIDLKHNGYVIGPGSVVGGRPYEIVRGTQPAPFPGWLATRGRKADPGPAPVGPPASGTEVADRVAELAAELATTPDGSGNRAFTRVAFKVGQYVGAGQIGHDEAFTALAAVPASWSYPGAPEKRQRDLRTIERQLRKGAESPRPWTASTEAPKLKPFGPPMPSGAAPPVPKPAAIVEPLPAEAVSSWLHIDLTPVLTGTRERTVPTIGHRFDGARVLYPGKEHVIAGEPESGKTWFAAKLVRDELIDGGRVLYVDFEDDEWTIAGRLQGLGLCDHRFEPDVFRYVRPESAPTPDELTAALTFPDGPATLVVFDGWTEGAGLLGLDIMSQDDITRWRRGLIRPCLAVGAATLTTDHVVKDKENRGRYSIGAQHKLAGLTGAMFITEARDTWGRGNKGRSRILISKDRNGSLRTNGVGIDNAANLTHFADLVGDAESGDMTRVDLYPPFSDDGPRIGYTKTQRKSADAIIAYLIAAKQPPSKNAIHGKVGGGKSNVLAFIDVLEADGFIERVPLGGSRFGYKATDKEFEEDE